MQANKIMGTAVSIRRDFLTRCRLAVTNFNK